MRLNDIRDFAIAAVGFAVAFVLVWAALWWIPLFGFRQIEDKTLPTDEQILEQQYRDCIGDQYAVPDKLKECEKIRQVQ